MCGFKNLCKHTCQVSKDHFWFHCKINDQYSVLAMLCFITNTAKTFFEISFKHCPRKASHVRYKYVTFLLTGPEKIHRVLVCNSIFNHLTSEFPFERFSTSRAVFIPLVCVKGLTSVCVLCLALHFGSIWFLW